MFSSTTRVRRTKEDAIPDSLILPPGEVLLSPTNQALFKLKSKVAMLGVFRQVSFNRRNSRILWLTLTRDRDWRENLRRVRAHLYEESLAGLQNGRTLFFLGFRRADCACTSGLGHRADCPNRPRIPWSRKKF